MKASIEDYMDCTSEQEFEALERLPKDDSFEGVEDVVVYYRDGEFHSVQIRYY